MSKLIRRPPQVSQKYIDAALLVAAAQETLWEADALERETGDGDGNDKINDLTQDLFHACWTAAGQAVLVTDRNRALRGTKKRNAQVRRQRRDHLHARGHPRDACGDRGAGREQASLRGGRSINLTRVPCGDGRGG